MKPMKSILIVAMVVMASTAYGQVSSSNHSGQRTLQVGLFYSYNQNLSSDNITLGPERGFRTDYDPFNFTVGLTALYYLNNNFALRSGVGYANRDFSGTFYCHVCIFAPPGPQRQKIELQFIQVPIALRYYPYNQQIGFFGEVGLLNQFMIKKPALKRLKEHTYLVSAMLAAGLTYDFGDSLTAELSVRYTDRLSEMFKNADYSYQTVGVQLGLLTHF